MSAEIPEDIVIAAEAVAASCEDDFYFYDIKLAAERAILAERLSHADAIATKDREIAETRAEIAQMAEIGAKAERFRISPDVTVESRGLGQWAVCDGGSVLNADGEWEYEPRPSNRPDDFIERTRFSFSDAYSRAAAAIRSLGKEGSGE